MVNIEKMAQTTPAGAEAAPEPAPAPKQAKKKGQSLEEAAGLAVPASLTTTIEGLFSLTFDDIKPFVQLVQAVSNVIDEPLFVIDSEGLQLYAIDPSHVMMVHARFPPEFFTEFSGGDKRTEMYLSIHDLKKVLSKARQDTIKMTIVGGNLEIKMIGTKKTTRRFSLKARMPNLNNQIEIDGIVKLKTVLDERWTTTIDLESGVFEQIVSDCDIIADIIKISVDKASKFASFEAAGVAGDLLVEMDLASENVLDADIKGDAEGMYSLTYAGYFKIASATSCKICLGVFLPMGLVATVANETNPNGTATLTFLLAPRVEDEAEDEDDDGPDEQIDTIDGPEDQDQQDLENYEESEESE